MEQPEVPSEAPAVESPLTERASIALLTLQLRAALREADQAERDERAWDEADAAAQLRERLAPMFAERQQSLAADLNRVRAQAASRVVAARALLAQLNREQAEARAIAGELAASAEDGEIQEVEQPVAAAEAVASETVAVLAAASNEPIEATGESQSVDAEGGQADVDDTGLVVDAELDAGEVVAGELIDADEVVAGVLPDPTEVGSADADADELATGVLVDPTDDDAMWAPPRADAPERPLTADDVRRIVVEALAAANPPARPVASQPDEEVMSRAFAAAFGAAFGAVLDDRANHPAMSHWTSRYPAAPQPMQPAVRTSFWRNMWHADVVLSVLAALIVIVVLIAWST